MIRRDFARLRPAPCSSTVRVYRWYFSWWRCLVDARAATRGDRIRACAVNLGPFVDVDLIADGACTVDDLSVVRYWANNEANQSLRKTQLSRRRPTSLTYAISYTRTRSGSDAARLTVGVPQTNFISFKNISFITLAASELLSTLYDSTSRARLGIAFGESLSAMQPKCPTSRIQMWNVRAIQDVVWHTVVTHVQNELNVTGRVSKLKRTL